MSVVSCVNKLTIAVTDNMLRVTLRLSITLRTVNFRFAKVINFLPERYQKVC